MVESIAQDNANRASVEMICEVLGVSRSGFYAWKNRAPSERSIANRDLAVKIEKVFEQSRNTYGSPRVTEKLKSLGVSCSENRVAKLMSRAGLRSVTAKKFKVMTTDSNHEHPIAPRLFEAENSRETLERANQVWCGDITFIETKQGWLYLAMYIDAMTKKIVGHATDANMKSDLVVRALEMALSRQRILPGNTIVHTDRGVQFASNEFRKVLKQNGLIRSMSRHSNCYDNSFAESFFSRLKTEMIYPRKYLFETREEAKKAVFEWIEVFYNRERMHSSIGFKNPVEFEKQMLAS